MSTTVKESLATPTVVIDIEQLANDRGAFNALIYTPLQEAMEELSRRRHELAIPQHAAAPRVLQGSAAALIFRQVFTPNYEVRRFLSIVDATELRPVFWEYHRDKFTSNNEWKHSLGKLHFYQGVGKKGGAKIDTVNVIDFNQANGRPIHKVKTLWGESLIRFHHRFLAHSFHKMPIQFFDASSWFKKNGKNADGYYETFLALLVRDGILFENFMLEGEEGEFTRRVFLPAFMKVWNQTGHKPLIVSLEPTDIEGDKFWVCYPQEDRMFVDTNLVKQVNPHGKKGRWNLSRILSLWI